MNLALPILFLVATIGAIGSCVKAVWHFAGMLRGIRSSADTWVNLLPFVALALPGSLDSTGKAHRAKFVVWLLATAAFAIVAIAVRQIAGDEV